VFRNVPLSRPVSPQSCFAACQVVSDCLPASDATHIQFRIARAQLEEKIKETPSMRLHPNHTMLPRPDSEWGQPVDVPPAAAPNLKNLACRYRDLPLARCERYEVVVNRDLGHDCMQVSQSCDAERKPGPLQLPIARLRRCRGQPPRSGA
jgi:hypothetical protein